MISGRLCVNSTFFRRSTMQKYVYLFSEGNAQMRNTLGGKGANLS